MKVVDRKLTELYNREQQVEKYRIENFGTNT